MSHAPVLLLDRDGVLNRDRNDYVLSVDQLEILPGVPQAVARLKQAGVRVVVITNQGAVAKGLLTEEELARIHARLRKILTAAGGGVDEIFYCPHHNADQCACRKPKPGMILAAQKKWGFEPGHTWMVGDTRRDLEAAQAAGCRGALVLTGHLGALDAADLGVPVFADLAAFVQAYLDPAHPLFAALRVNPTATQG